MVSVQTLAQIRALLDDRGLSPKKSLGQNFLIDHNLIRRLVDAAEVRQDSLVLEVGPGTGTLTEELLDRGCRVVACELDDHLCDLLLDRLTGRTGFTLVRGDCLGSKRSLSPALAEELADQPFQLIANLPYGAGTPLLLVLLTRFPQCRAMHVTIQREVADRIMAAPGSEEYGSISVVARAAAEVKRLATLPPACFWPRPKVDSAMIALVRRPRALTDDLVGLADVVQRLFTQRRKQIAPASRTLGIPLPPDLEPTRRVCEMSPDEFVKVAAAVDKV
ncbi:MAG: ribosomal RNA small subunit methyltransferase A [Leptolyngbya sp. PLA3]|nr:MAG: ribosomal RNA small subunit methyltransferase A [Cyanobacteria bacterium CYA]MCE7967916.1 ribosomal RNA small subunit methyltransferase A [Leptolyngbya sp. PL-A3]